MMDSAKTSDASEEAFQQATFILIVEDDPDIGEILLQAIEVGTSFQASLVPDGFQALKIIQDIKPHLFILDYQLPRLSGLELYDQLHAPEGLGHIPTLFLSANPPLEELEKRHVSFLEKPFEVNDLLRAIVELLE
jgi:CheY-like chemotaxis protein